MPPESTVARLPTRFGWARSLTVPIAAVAIVASATWYRSGLPDQPALVPTRLADRYAGHDYARALAETEAKIAALKTRIATPHGDMIDREQLSITLVGRSRLTGDFSDLAAARAAAADGIAISPPGTGPWLASAAADLTAHRVSEAETALDHVDRFVVPDAMTRAEARAMRADIAMAHGRDAEAARWIAEAESIETWPGLVFRKALLARVAGDLDGARSLFVEADALERNPSPRFRSDMLMRRGELDFAQGKWKEAAALYAEAARVFPGYWRADMRVAQMAALSGEIGPAISAFEAIARDADAPEAMDIVAGLYRARGDATASRAWAARAGAIWQKRLKLLPEAAWAHAAEHELAFGDPRAALGFAGRNARNRPNGAGLILLAKVWIANGRADYALALCDRVARSGWISTELWLVKAEALSLLGRGAEAEAARAKAEALNPRALGRDPAFAWLDH